MGIVLRSLAPMKRSELRLEEGSNLNVVLRRKPQAKKLKGEGKERRWKTRSMLCHRGQGKSILRRE